MIATTCPLCGGSLRLGARFCATVSLQCRSCNDTFTQLVPSSYAVGLRPDPLSISAIVRSPRRPASRVPASARSDARHAA